jgi:hypothetical protein
MKYVLLLAFFWCTGLQAQVPDSVYMPNIYSAKLFLKGNQLAYPVISPGAGSLLELQFDDLDADVKNYYYTYQLCNADWKPVEISTFDYIQGFAQSQITDYHYSSVALVRYTHYHVSLPENNSRIILSGNYILKVYLNNDTSQIAFTKRLLVVQNAVAISAKIVQTQNPQFSGTHQKLEFNVNSKSLSISSPFQQLHVVILQNNRWDNAIYMGDPSFYSGTNFQYNSDDIPVFPGGNQWRYIDLQSFRFQSDRIARADYQKNATVLFAKPDKDRSGQAYIFYADVNGAYYLQTTDLVDPYYQTDYARVHFSFVPPDKTPFDDKDVYLLGEFTGYKINESTRLNFNALTGSYEGSALLKMGVYNYAYVTLSRHDPSPAPSFEFTEGNYFETENNYDILVYYRPLGGRADQLVGMYSLNTMNTVR